LAQAFKLIIRLSLKIPLFSDTNKLTQIFYVSHLGCVWSYFIGNINIDSKSMLFSFPISVLQIAIYSTPTQFELEALRIDQDANEVQNPFLMK
jgi:hypothetical protein